MFNELFFLRGEIPVVSKCRASTAASPFIWLREHTVPPLLTAGPLQTHIQHRQAGVNNWTAQCADASLVCSDSCRQTTRSMCWPTTWWTDLRLTQEKASLNTVKKLLQGSIKPSYALNECPLTCIALHIHSLSPLDWDHTATDLSVASVCVSFRAKRHTQPVLISFSINVIPPKHLNQNTNNRKCLQSVSASPWQLVCIVLHTRAPPMGETIVFEASGQVLEKNHLHMLFKLSILSVMSGESTTPKKDRYTQSDLTFSSIMAFCSGAQTI